MNKQLQLKNTSYFARSKQTERDNKMITKQMVNKYLDKDYHKWIANVITDICNDPSEISILKKQIKEDWDLRNMLKKYDKTLIPNDK